MAKSKAFIVVLHVVCWIMVALPPIIFAPQNIPQDTVTYMLRLALPLLMCAVFYINYFWLVPRFCITHKTNIFLCANIIIIILASLCMQEFTEIIHLRERAVGYIPPPADHSPLILGIFVFILRNVFSLGLSAVVATLLKLAMKWQTAETARRELEIKKTEAELKNLRNQINPHFLLNTLNNIYALISFNQDKAQSAVLSLSALLRQMLYGGQDNAVSLKDETDFIRNYIDLMRLRMSKNVKITVDINVAAQAEVVIAPFILISLVENAFKHGVCPTEPSFISIKINTDGQRIVCEIKNSNHPKSSSDKSGHGIGLQQVAQRLDLAYKDKYEWTKGVNEKNDI